MEEMRAEIRAQQSETSISMLQLLLSPSLRMPLCIAIVMQLSQQLSGINAVSFEFSFLSLLGRSLHREFTLWEVIYEWKNPNEGFIN